MPRWIALLRGVNVGGNNKMSMERLRNRLASIGLAKVRTLIQSGNVVFDSKSKSASSLGKKILDAIEAEFEFRPKLTLLSQSQFLAAAKAVPYLVDDPKSVHIFFLESKPASPDIAALKLIAKNSEQFLLDENNFYLLAPDGIGNSKLAAAVERKLGVSTTARNLNTVNQLLKMIDEP